jgi:hypothetical protein
MDEKRPSNVVWFERLMYLSIALGVINTALNWNRLVAMANRMGVVFVVFVGGFVFGMLIWLIWLVARKAKHWARWVQLGLFVLGTPRDIRMVVHNLSDRPAAGTFGLVQFALQVAALILIFTGNARDWFKREAA